MNTPETGRSRQTERRLTGEYTTAFALAQSATLAEAARRVLQAICEDLGWDYGAMWNIDAGSGVLRCVEIWHLPDVHAPEFEAVSHDNTFVRGVGLPGRVWESGEPAWIPDVVADDNFPRAAIASKEGLHAAIALPVRIRARVAGVMEFFSHEIRQPDEELLRMLADVGAQIGQFMERKRAEEELDRFFNLSLDLMCVAGFDGYFKRLNPVWERTLGYTMDELLARPYLDFVHPEDQSTTTTEAGRLSGGIQVMKFENRYRHKDGTYRWLEWAAVPLASEQTIYAAARDITERKEARETIARYSADLAAARKAQAEDASRLSRIVSELEVRNLLQIVQNALGSSDAAQAIEVTSAHPHWVELLVPCTREAADKIEMVVERLGADLPENVLDSVAYAFRELLLNAVEWGGQLDPNRKVRIACLRTNRMLMYRIADPGPGFNFDNLAHSALSHPDQPVEHMRIREEQGLRPGGFGILMVKAKVDELVYNEKHNEVIFIKYLEPPEQR
jgi:PAS domain S-box-containing protein